MDGVTIKTRTTPYRAWSAEGARVGIMSCLECGAALFIDPDDAKGTDGKAFDPVVTHIEWHDAQEFLYDNYRDKRKPSNRGPTL